MVKALRIGDGAIWHGTSRAPRRRCAETDLLNAGSLAKEKRAPGDRGDDQRDRAQREPACGPGSAMLGRSPSRRQLLSKENQILTSAQRRTSHRTERLLPREASNEPRLRGRRP